MTSRMQVAFFSSLAAFTLLFAALFWHRFRLGRAQNKLRQRQNELDFGGEE